MKRIKLYSLPIIMLALIASLQFVSDNEDSRRTKTEPIIFPAEVIKAADLGLHSAAADLAWIASIQYFGDYSYTKYEKLSAYLDLVTSLDPDFSYPYAFGTLVLTGLDKTDEAINLANKGLGLELNDWQIPYYLGTTYHIYKDDQENASRYFDLAANTPGVPENIKYVAANYGSRSDRREKEIAIWQGIYDNSQDEIIKERAANYIGHLQLMTLLEEAGKQYFQKNGQHPSNPNDLIENEILKFLPDDPLGFRFEYDQNGNLLVI